MSIFTSQLPPELDWGIPSYKNLCQELMKNKISAIYRPDYPNLVGFRIWCSCCNNAFTELVLQRELVEKHFIGQDNYHIFFLYIRNWYRSTKKFCLPDCEKSPKDMMKKYRKRKKND